MNAPQVLIVEDDAALRGALCQTMEFGGYQVLNARNGKDALAVMDRETVDIVISDVQMDEMDGTELLQVIRRREPTLPFVMMTAHGSVQHAVQSMRDGATDYLQKPFEANVLLDMVSRMETQLPSQSSTMVAEDAGTQQIVDLALRVALTDASVLISGESGTGKEVLARAVHEGSERSEGPFIALNCAAIPENMLEAILFGYEKGAFTGAHKARPGKFEQANGGTLLLDEITEMPIELQAKLLRVLQEREVERLGGTGLIDLDVRVIATTNRALPEEVAAGRFRQDLYYRLNVFPLELPPLRERTLDIEPLVKRFLANHGQDRVLSVSDAAVEKLAAHSWPGNIRELDNCIQRAVILASSSEIGPEAIVFDALPEAASTDPVDAPALDGDLKARERELIFSALSAVRGNRKQACTRLGISERTLRYKLARFRDEGYALPEGIA
ncbi:MAG: sigma-54 dependent transcriptional regulator [Luminiphilus sp.]|nr:sigma-54 dependent transcriptional regulator [Luminiphilus sp.]